MDKSIPKISYFFKSKNLLFYLFNKSKNFLYIEG